MPTPAANLPKPKPGLVFETTFYPNPKKQSPYPWRATHLNGVRAPKAILTSDPKIESGMTAKVRVTRVTQPARKDRGHIEVEFLSRVEFKIAENFHVDPLVSLKLQALLESGKNILLDGPQGSGKTALSRHLADALKMEYVFFNCSAVYEPSDFIATIQVQAGPSGQPVTHWTKTAILKALEAAPEHPDRQYLIFLDEFNRCREMARNGLLPALDIVRRIYNPINGDFIPIPDNIQWIAAVNNGAQFTGTTSVDPAQLDRFAPVQVDYPPEKAELRLLASQFPTVERKQLQRVVRLANIIRSDTSLNLDLSYRATEEACLLLSHPNFVEQQEDPLPDILKSSFCGRFFGRWSDPSTDSGMVWERLQKAMEEEAEAGRKRTRKDRSS